MNTVDDMVLLGMLVFSYLCENSSLRYQKQSSQDVDLQSVASVRYEELRERRDFVINTIICQQSEILISQCEILHLIYSN